VRRTLPLGNSQKKKNKERKKERRESSNPAIMKNIFFRFWLKETIR